MSQAAARAPKLVPQAPNPAPAPQRPKTGIVAWLLTWRQVLIAELLNVMERRRCD
jgi:hypothetical protein